MGERMTRASSANVHIDVKSVEAAEFHCQHDDGSRSYRLGEYGLVTVYVQPRTPLELRQAADHLSELASQWAKEQVD